MISASTGVVVKRPNLAPVSGNLLADNEIKIDKVGLHFLLCETDSSKKQIVLIRHQFTPAFPELAAAHAESRSQRNEVKRWEVARSDKQSAVPNAAKAE